MASNIFDMIHQTSVLVNHDNGSQILAVFRPRDVSTHIPGAPGKLNHLRRQTRIFGIDNVFYGLSHFRPPSKNFSGLAVPRIAKNQIQIQSFSKWGTTKKREKKDQEVR